MNTRRKHKSWKKFWTKKQAPVPITVNVLNSLIRPDSDFEPSLRFPDEEPVKTTVWARWKGKAHLLEVDIPEDFRSIRPGKTVGAIYNVAANCPTARGQLWKGAEIVKPVDGETCSHCSKLPVKK